MALIQRHCSGRFLLTESHELFVDEAAFTGETFPVEKNAGMMSAATPLAKRSNGSLILPR